MGFLLFLTLELKIPSLQTIFYHHQRIKCEYIELILETTNLPNTEKSVPGLEMIFPSRLTAPNTYPKTLSIYIC